MKRVLESALLLLGALVALASLPVTAGAQQQLDSRWLPWLGCWQPTAEDVGPSDLMVCVRPASDAAGVEVATISQGQTVSRRTLVADDQTHELNEDGCVGWQRAAFSADGQRAYLRSDLACDGGVHRSASAIMAIGSQLKWLDVQSVGMNGERVPRVVDYGVAPSSRWPADYALSPARAVQVDGARRFAAAPMTLTDVKEASSQVDREALVAFLVERAEPFDLDAGQLESLASAGVPDQVIDVIVAVSFPDRFRIDRQALRMALAPPQSAPKAYAVQRVYYDPFGWGYSPECYPGSAYCNFSYGYGMYGYGLGFYSPYGYQSPYWYGYSNQPCIIVMNPGGASQEVATLSGGQVVNGSGYTRGGEVVTGTARPRGSSASPAASAGGDRRGSPTVTHPATQPSASPSGYTRGSGSSASPSRGTAKPKCCNQ
jgi:hypothetical protein